MLKIKDNIDLKELLKYGFKKDDIYYEDYIIESYAKLEEKCKIWVDVNGSYKRQIYISEINEINCEDDRSLDTIYDLIKDGLVEKVEE